MPITSGHGNPDWAREETLLALDLLYRHGKPVGRHHADVVELSALLGRATIHPIERRADRFRNADGVALKMQNLYSAVEPGRGLSYSKGDAAAVAEFPRESKTELADLAKAIREAIDHPLSEPSPSDEEEAFFEGQWFTSRHRHRERRLRLRLLAKVKDGQLTCEICSFTPPALDRPIQESFFEAHHRKPLAEAEHERVTKVADMSLLCASCHRFLHKLIVVRKRWVGSDEARQVLQSVAPEKVAP